MSETLLLGWQRPTLPSLPMLRHRLAPAIPRMVARASLGAGLLALAGVLAVSAFGFLRPPASAVAPAPPPRPPDWLDVPRPLHIFDLEAPTLRGLPLVYSARRRSGAEGREDVLAYGAPGTDAPALRLRLYRRAEGVAVPSPLFAAIAKQAAESGLSVSHAGLADLLPTRFGAFELADVVLSDAKAADVTCSGFRLALDRPSLTIGGLACGAAGKPMARAELACLIDRVDLHSGGEDRAMIDFFAASERHRDPNCRGARLAPDTLHAAWLDDKPVTHARTSRRR